MNDQLHKRLYHYKQELQALVTEAYAKGIILTIESSKTEKGWQKFDVDARPVRAIYSKENV